MNEIQPLFMYTSSAHTRIRTRNIRCAMFSMSVYGTPDICNLCIFFHRFCRRDPKDFLIVKVKAQVMTRDETTEGWLPLQGGGIATVSVRKRCKPSADVTEQEEFIIYGQRISDQMVILSCVINKDLQYNKVMPVSSSNSYIGIILWLTNFSFADISPLEGWQPKEWTNISDCC